MDFIQNEELFFKYFIKAWHMGTENGLDLQPLNKKAADTIDKKQKEQESVKCTDLSHRDCETRGDYCKKSLMDVRPEQLSQYNFGCTNKHRPQSNQRGELSHRPNFFKEVRFGDGYTSNMNQRSTQYRGLVQLTNPTASSEIENYPASNVLNRQKGWNKSPDKAYL